MNRKAVDMRGDGGRRGEKIADECEQSGPLGWELAAHTLFIHCFLTSSSLSSSTFHLLFTLLCPSLYSHSSLASLPPRFHFFSHHLSCCLERLMYSAFITTRLCLLDQQDSSLDLAAAALKPTTCVSQTQINTVYLQYISTSDFFTG